MSKFLLWLLLLISSKEEKEMIAMVFVSLIIKGKKKFHEAPIGIKEQVRQILIDLDLEDLIDE